MSIDAVDGPGICAKCGRRHVLKSGKPSCAGHKSARDAAGNLVPCSKSPIAGGYVCQTHGGGAPHVKAAAAERLRDAAILEGLSFNIRDVRPEHLNMSADEQLLIEVARSAQAVEWLADEVAKLRVPSPEDGPMANVIGIDENGEPIIAPPTFMLYGPNHNGDLATHPLWNKLDTERDRHARMCKDAIGAGISERLVRIAETMAQQIVGTILYVFDNLDITPAIREQARQLAASRLRSLTAVTLGDVVETN